MIIKQKKFIKNKYSDQNFKPKPNQKTQNKIPFYQMKQIILLLLVIILAQSATCPTNAPFAINITTLNQTAYIGCITERRVVGNCQSYQYTGQIAANYSILQCDSQCQVECQQGEAQQNRKISNLKCLKCHFGFDIDYQFDQCVPSVQLCSTVTVTGLCTSCIPGSILVRQACFSAPQNCQEINLSTVLCKVCKSGYQIIDGVCLQTVTCSQGQYLNTSRQCQNGTIENCANYSQQGICLYCKQHYRFTSDLTKCYDTRPITCPPNTSQLKYALIQGQCIAFDINCNDRILRKTGCISCKDNYYKIGNKCYQI